ncbi:hypothetical protein ACFODO_15435 [Acinetobacter sichuanensis]|uniref:Uncharacterized protein n=1 Tax=Acinetobacter sichuanensis TaxID=2136183 RepID=A0A371YVJ8_9GAMM|nr:hypothetical protein [Acinetobacter sichuanensis]RFC85462.1 hypothetical protein C9E89_000635 [Acinetobacter sichuanensis]
MIPFSFSYLWIFFIAAIGSLVFCLFAIGLIFSAQCRTKLKNGNIFLQSLFVTSCLCVLLSIGLFFLVKKAQLEVKTDHEATYQTLTSPQNILGISMPTGTELYLFEANNQESFREATFPTPVAFGNFQINNIQIPRGYELEMFDDRSITLRGKGVDQIEGWQCKLENYIKVYLDEQANISGLEFCILANPIKLKQITLQAGADIQRSKYSKYPDGFIAQDTWQIRNPLTHYKNISVEWANIYLDKNHQLLGIENGTLAKDLHFGGIDYPQGTEFNFLLHPLIKNQETWLFTPPTNKTAKAKDGTVYTDQQAILHTTDGQVLKILNANDEKTMARRSNRS